MKEQKYFERSLKYGWQESEREFRKLLQDGWKIVLAIPIQSGMSCHTYTSEIHYVLEREAKVDESDND